MPRVRSFRSNPLVFGLFSAQLVCVGRWTFTGINLLLFAAVLAGLAVLSVVIFADL